MTKPLAIDLFCGLGGWAEGLLAEGWDVIGFDIERHVYGEQKYPGLLAIQHVLTLHGSQFKGASLIVASPPCQEYSYMAMPWSRAKTIAAEYRSGKRDVKDLTRLFDACFRIQREACEAAGRHIPLVVENVRGAIPWVGRSRWNFGSFHLWGDVPALMPPIGKRKLSGRHLGLPKEGEERRIWGPNHIAPDSEEYARLIGLKVPGFRFDGSGRSFQTASVEGLKGVPHKPTGHWTNPAENGIKMRDADGYERDHPNAFGWKSPRTSSRATQSRKAASAMIAKIPLPLSRHIAQVFKQ